MSTASSPTSTQTKQLKTEKQVYLFGTCLIDMFYPQAGLDAVTLLELCGYEVIYPQDQTCCGQPPYNSGFKTPAIKIAKQTINLFNNANIPLIVPSASCAGMIKHQYPSLFSPQSQEAQLANNLAQRTFELIDFIADKLPYQQQPLRAQAKIVLHESCSALREMNAAQNWRRVLKKLDHVEVSYPKNNQECCGFGGTFSVKSDAISAVMTQDKCHNLLNTQSDQIVSGDCGCLMNIGEHLKYDNKPDTCTHLASFLVEYFRQRHAP